VAWEQVALQDVAKVVGGSTPRRDNPSFWDGDIPWLTPTDLPSLGSGVTNVCETTSHITEEGFKGTSLSLLPPSTVVFSSRATIGKVGVTSVPITTNQGFVNFIPNERIEPRYLAWVLYQHVEQIAALSGSTTFKEVSRTSLKKFRIPLPPKDEQRRIAHLLDAAHEIQRLRKEANEKARRILPALFLELFGDPATNPRGWEVRTVGEVAVKFSDGPFGSNLKSSHYVDSGVRVIRLQNIGAGEFLDNDKAYVSESHFATISKHECRPGDVLIGTLGDPNLRAVVQPEWLTLGLNKSDCVQLRPNPEIANAHYLAALLNNTSVLGMAQALILGQTRGRIAMGRLRNLAVPIPPLPLQEKFAEYARASESIGGRTREATESTEHFGDTLRSRLFASQHQLQGEVGDR